MADISTTTTPTPTPATGGLNFENYRKKVEQAAATTRKVEGGTVPEDVTRLVTRAPEGPGRVQGEAALTQYSQEYKDTKEQAGKAATGLEMVGEQTERFMQNLEGIQGRLESQVKSARDSFGAAAEKADEYVTAARSRVGEMLGKIDELNTQIAKDRDFGKSHAMQTAVQATLGSMKNEERNILETYGTDSKEFQQFQASKRVALGTVQSNIHATYQQLSERQSQSYLGATVDVMTKGNMYVGFQEQQHVEMLKYKDSAKNAFNLQVAQFQTGVEQLKMAGMENLANWLIETPSFSMDMTPLVTLLTELNPQQGGDYVPPAGMNLSNVPGIKKGGL